MTNPPTPQHVPLPDPGFVLEELDQELLLFHPQDGRLLELNATAALVWQLCDGVRTVAVISGLIADAYPQDAASIAQDVPDILVELNKLGAVHWR